MSTALLVFSNTIETNGMLLAVLNAFSSGSLILPVLTSTIEIMRSARNQSLKPVLVGSLGC